MAGEEELEKLYTATGEAGSWGSAEALRRAARRQGLSVGREEAERFVAAYPSNTLFRRRRRLPLVNFAITKDQKWQLDLGFYPAFRGITAFLIWSLTDRALPAGQ